MNGGGFQKDRQNIQIFISICSSPQRHHTAEKRWHELQSELTSSLCEYLSFWRNKKIKKVFNLAPTLALAYEIKQCMVLSLSLLLNISVFMIVVYTHTRIFILLSIYFRHPVKINSLACGMYSLFLVVRESECDLVDHILVVENTKKIAQIRFFVCCSGILWVCQVYVCLWLATRPQV